AIEKKIENSITTVIKQRHIKTRDIDCYTTQYNYLPSVLQ
ncbi:unnamed protein product, partial [Rotaria sp. Silwood1]